MVKLEDVSLVSIGIPFYNAEIYLRDAICSVLAQTYKNWELILIDDGSTDNSLEIAKSFEKKDSRIRVISDGKNMKLSYRLNQIIDLAKYDYISRMDADDIMDSSRIDKQVKVLNKNKDIDLVATGILSISNTNDVHGIRIYKNINMKSFDMISGNIGIVHPSVMARKSWYLRNKYKENIVSEDYELWNRAFYKNDLKLYKIEEPLYYYREDGNVTYKKLIKAYKDQISIASSYRSSLDIVDYIKIKHKMYLKITAASILNKLGQINLLLRLRNTKQPTSQQLEIFKMNLKNITEFK